MLEDLIKSLQEQPAAAKMLAALRKDPKRSAVLGVLLIVLVVMMARRSDLPAAARS